MQYYKSVIDGLVVTVSTVNADGDGNITEEEYNTLVELFYAMPDGKTIRDYGDGTYAYEDAPPPDPDPEMDDSAALEILLGGAA